MKETERTDTFPKFTGKYVTGEHVSYNVFFLVANR